MPRTLPEYQYHVLAQGTDTIKARAREGRTWWFNDLQEDDLKR